MSTMGERCDLCAPFCIHTCHWCLAFKTKTTSREELGWEHRSHVSEPANLGRMRFFFCALRLYPRPADRDGGLGGLPSLPKLRVDAVIPFVLFCVELTALDIGFRNSSVFFVRQVFLKPGKIPSWVSHDRLVLRWWAPGWILVFDSCE